MKEADRRTIAPREDIIRHNRLALIWRDIINTPATLGPQESALLKGRQRSYYIALASACVSEAARLDAEAGR